MKRVFFSHLIYLLVSCLSFACSQDPFKSVIGNLSSTSQNSNSGPFTSPAPAPIGPLQNSAPVNAVIINPTDDANAIVQNNPEGSVFYFTPGLYRMQSIQVKNQDQFIGAYGAVLNGSKILNTWNFSNGYWNVSGQTQQGQAVDPGDCLPISPRCYYSEDLFIDNVPYTQAPSLAALTAGQRQWFFDYNAQTIYLADDPTNHLVETSVARSAFFNTQANGVIIQNFVVEKYAIPLQMGAIGDQYPGLAWIIQNNEVRLNHGAGISSTDNFQVLNNHVHHNGEKGIGGSGKNILIQNNEINNNNYYSGVSCNWECGGAKFAVTTGLVVKGNFSHDNYGPGFWDDIDCINTLYDGNTILRNQGPGIQHEISFQATIQNNVAENNGVPSSTWLWNSQILIQNSQNVEVKNNTIIVSDPATTGLQGNAIGIIYQERGMGAYGSHDHVAGNSIHDNTITFMSGFGNSGIVSDVNSGTIADINGNVLPPNGLVTDGTNNLFYSNHYYIPNASANIFYWMFNGYLQFTDTQALGQEKGSSLNTF